MKGCIRYKKDRIYNFRRFFGTKREQNEKGGRKSLELVRIQTEGDGSHLSTKNKLDIETGSNQRG